MLKVEQIIWKRINELEARYARYRKIIQVEEEMELRF